MKKLFIILFVFFLTQFLYADHLTFPEQQLLKVEFVYDGELLPDSIQHISDTCKYQAARKIKAVIITILTGPLGGHRIYLGTKPVIPVIYALTLGGGIVVTVIDLFHLIFTGDISKYEKNNRFFMWLNKD